MKTKLLFCASVVALSASALAGAFTTGDIVVDRVGTGSVVTNGTAAAVFLDEYTTAGTAVESIELPTSASGLNNDFTQSISAASEGELSLSPNGQYLALAGYDAPVGTSGISSTNTTGAGGVARTIAIVSGNGNVDTSTILTGAALDGNNIRSAVTTDGTNIYVAGAVGGVDYTTDGSTGSNDFTELNTTDTNFQQVGIFGGQLYASSGKKSLTVATIGSNLPTTGSQTVTNLAGLPTSGTDAGFYFADVGSGSPNDLYMAYATGSIAEVAKYYLSGGSWHSAGTITETGIEGITGQVVGSNVDLYFTTPTNIYSVVDTSGQSGTLTGTPTSIASAASNESFLGLAFAPIPEPSTWAAILSGLATLFIYQSRRRGRGRAWNG